MTDYTLGAYRVCWVTRLILKKKLDPNHIFKIGEDRHFKFGLLTDSDTEEY